MTTVTLVFPAGSGPGSSQNFEVPVVNDAIVEGDETINIQATVVGGVGTFVGGAATGPTTLTIIDDDGKLDSASAKVIHS